MSGASPPDDTNFDVSVEPAPRNDVVDVEEDEESKRAREAALASTYDQTIAHVGKTDDEMLAERQADARQLTDAAIVAGVVIIAAQHADSEDLDLEDAVPPEMDDGGE